MESLLNNFPEFVLFGSVFLFYAATTLFIFLLFVSEATENGWLALASFGIFVLLTSVWSNLEPLDHLTNWEILAAYVGFGFVHSLIRTFIYGKKRKPKRLEAIQKREEWFDKNPDADRDRDYSIDGIHHVANSIIYYDEVTKGKLKGNVFRWWFLWPVSLLTWIASDFIRDAWKIIYNFFKGLFESILNMAMK